MFTREYIQMITAYCDEMDSESAWARNMTFEKKLDEIFTYAQERDDYLVMTVFILDELDEDSDVNNLIHLFWGSEEGFFANVKTRDKKVELNISDVKMKCYGTNEMPDYEVVIDKGLDLLNKICGNT